MTDSIKVFDPGYRLTTAANAVVSGGKLKFYNAGGLVARTVYSDLGLSTSLGSTVYTGSDGMPVASSGSSTEVSVYTGTTAYKIVATTSADVEIWTLDNLVGALDTSTFLTSSSTSTLSIPVVSKVANYTLVAGDRGKLVQGNTTGGNFTLTLTAAATLGDGWNVEIRNSGTSGQLILAASEAIAFEGQSFTSRALEIGEAMTIRCDGTAFKIVAHTPPLMAARGPGVIVITDRVTADPSSPTPGARYIVQTGYGSYATGDIIEANGTSFNKYTPAADCGWVAYVQDEDRYYSFQGSAWVLGMEPAASDTVSGLIELAVQSEMETATDVARAVVPGRQHFHPAHPKAWARVAYSGGVPAASRSHNVTSITDTGTGNALMNLTTAMSDGNGAALATIRNTSAVRIDTIHAGTISAGSASIVSFIANTTTDTAGLANDADFSFALLGDI